MRYLWKIFIQLSDRRPSSFGPALIPWSEIDAFQRVTGFRLAPWEIRIIEELDVLFVTERSEVS